MNDTTRSWTTDIGCILLIFGMLYFVFLGVRPLAPPDEGRYSEIPREMIISHDYITPHLNGVKYFEKPVLFYWLQSASIHLFGLKEWSLRLMTAFMGLLGCLISYYAARKLYNRPTALLATLILGSSLLYASFSRYITLDMSVSTFLTGCCFCFLLAHYTPPGKRRCVYLMLMYVFAALAVLTKGLIGIVLPGLVISTWLTVTKQWQSLRSYALLPGSWLFLLIALPWHILVQYRNPEFLHFYIIEQHFLRYFTHYASREQPLWFLPLVLLVGFFPWTGFLVLAIKNLRFKWQDVTTPENSITLFCLLWAVLIFLFYWLSRSQLAPYILPVLPPLSLITANYLYQYRNEKNKQFGKSFLTSFLFSVIFVSAGLFLLHQSSMLITWRDSIIFVPWFFLLSVYAYLKRGLYIGLIVMVGSNAIFILMLNFYADLVEIRSVKPLAIKLNNLIGPNDTIYNFNNYFQDLPVYLNRQVKIINWIGELNFGSRYQETAAIFLDENKLLEQWPDPTRKFMIVKSNDYRYLLKVLGIKYYVLAMTKKYSLICNQLPSFTLQN